MDNLEIDYKKAAQQLRSGEALFGKDGALAPMLERILNAALEGEMDAHLNSADRSSGNRRNGKMSTHRITDSDDHRFLRPDFLYRTGRAAHCPPHAGNLQP